MKKYLNIFIILLIFLTLGYYVLTQQRQVNNIFSSSYSLLIVHSEGKEDSASMNAYRSILEEEGVSYYLIAEKTLLTINAKDVLENKPAILFPDDASTYINNDMNNWLRTYIKNGGHVMFVGNAGSKTRKGHYREKGSIFDNLIGIQTNTYLKNKDHSFLKGNISFYSLDDADYFEIPRGKINENFTISGYKYGPLEYPYANVKILNFTDLKLYAFAISDNKQIPIIAKKSLGKGDILYINLPLAYLKGYSDDLIPRSILKTFLFKIAHLPHIVSSPNGIGGLIVNWHIDSALELEALPWFLEQGYFSKSIQYSMCITAGPDCDSLGDNHGFDATGKGRKLIEALLPYGIIGSHGGWSHNLFATLLENGDMNTSEMQRFIKMNNQSLEKIIGYPIKEYAAPNGVFPQPSSVEVMKNLGIESYYYPGDSGSAPNRTFYEGKMVSNDIIAFPVMTFNDMASLNEFEKQEYSNTETSQILENIIDFIANNRTVRLYYSHPYDVYFGKYKQEVKSFLTYGVIMQQKGKIQIQTMSYFREFLLRLIETNKIFKWDNHTLKVQLGNKQNLKEMVIAIPKIMHDKKILLKGFEEDENYYYIPTDTNNSHYQLDLSYE